VAYYELGIVKRGSVVVVADDKENPVSSDLGKLLHVLYHSDDQKLRKAKDLLGQGCEAKPLQGDVVVFLTQAEAERLVENRLAARGDMRTGAR
jgi:hypothetical protein